MDLFLVTLWGSRGTWLDILPPVLGNLTRGRKLLSRSCRYRDAKYGLCCRGSRFFVRHGLDGVDLTRVIRCERSF